MVIFELRYSGTEQSPLYDHYLATYLLYCTDVLSGQQYRQLRDVVIARGVLNFELGTDVRPEVSTTTL